MNKDIQTREDLILLVDTFYQKIQENKRIGPIFTDIAKVDWTHHLPKMYDFWESVLFGNATYKGNPMLTHFELRDKATLKTDEFDIWKNIFFETVDDLFKGNNAESIKEKAKSIADLMNFKLNPPKPRINII